MWELEPLGGALRLARMLRTTLSVPLLPRGRDDQAALSAAALQRASRALLSAGGLRIELSGPLPARPSVLVCNHLSWFDPLVVATAVQLTAIAKHELSQWPLLGARASGLGTVFVDRLDAHAGVGALLRARAALRQGISVLNFPEGTTTRGDAVLPFRRGIFGLARLAGAPLVPLRLEVEPDLSWTGPDPIVPHLWRLCATRAPVARVRFFEPLPREGRSDAAWAEAARCLIARPLSLRPSRSLHAAAAALSARDHSQRGVDLLSAPHARRVS